MGGYTRGGVGLESSRVKRRIKGELILSHPLLKSLERGIKHALGTPYF